MKRSANSRANIQEFKEATDNESYAFLRKRVGEAKFHAHQNELANLVEKYTGGKFLLLNSIPDKIDDLEGWYDYRCCIVHFSYIYCKYFIGIKDDFRKQASVALETTRMHMPKDKITKNVSTDPSVKKALVMKDIGHDILNHGMIARGEVVIKITGIMEEEEFKRSNIFAYHWAHNSYNFATRALKTMFEVCKYYSVCQFSVVFLIYFLLFRRHRRDRLRRKRRPNTNSSSSLHNSLGLNMCLFTFTYVS